MHPYLPFVCIDITCLMFFRGVAAVVANEPETGTFEAPKQQEHCSNRALLRGHAYNMADEVAVAYIASFRN